MDQELALNILKTGANVFLTGSAGTGKSYTLNQYIGYLKKQRIRFAITASTGIAASHLKGSTIHSWSGIGVRENLTLKDLETIKKKKVDIAETATLIIDEISMFHSKQLVMLDQILKFCRDSDEPFGGIQVILCGDFFQLPPVEKNIDSGSKKFCFMSDAWVRANFSICYLTKQYRQNGDGLTQILNQIRDDTVTEDSLKIISETKSNLLDGGDITKLYTHNADVDRINYAHLSKLANKSFTHKYELSGILSLCEMIVNQSRIADEFEYKIGALVMFTKNNEEMGYCNGSTGVIVGTLDHEEFGTIPVVKLTTGGQIAVSPESWAVVDESGEAIASVVQLPLRLAWAITVHKSQGMTLDRAEIDLSGTFESGQAYVALSRLRSLDGMRVLGMNEMVTSIAPIVRKADSRFKELSLINVVKFQDFKGFSKAHKEFFAKCKSNGWLLKQGSNKTFKYKSRKAGTTSIGKRDINKTLNGSENAIQDLLKQKGVSHTTLIKNIQILCDKDSTIDLSKFRPSDEVISVVANTIKSYRSRGALQPLYKNNAMFIMQNIKMNGGSDLSEVDVWKSFLFLTDIGELR
jgi:hypothetical protein